LIVVEEVEGGVALDGEQIRFTDPETLSEKFDSLSPLFPDPAQSEMRQ
jgi:hypothetical protein